MQDGLVFRNERIVIPYSLRKLMVEKVHVAHNGIEATLKLARENIFWPGMSAQITEKVQGCGICAKFADSQQKPPMQTHEIPTYPFQFVSMDMFFAPYEGSIKKFLITVDHYSDYFDLNILRDASSAPVIEACKHNFSQHGIPQRVCTDNGSNFVNKDMAAFARSWGFQHVSSSPHHQQANGKAEAAVKIAKRIILKAAESKQDVWYSLLHWRNTPNKINSSPVQRINSRATRTGVPTSNNNLKPKVVENVSSTIEEKRQLNKHYYDKKTRDLPELIVGQPVVVQVKPLTSHIWSPGIIEEVLNDRSYIVNVDGSRYRRDLVHIKPQFQNNEQPNSLQTPDNPTTNESRLDIANQTVNQTPNALRIQNSQQSNQPTASTSATQAQSPTQQHPPAFRRSSRNRRLPVKLSDYVLNKINCR